MRLYVRHRVFLILVVLLLSVWSLYPPAEKIKRGLDLHGGVQFVLRVDTDGALRAQTEAAAERVREALMRDGIAFETAATTSATEFGISGVRKASSQPDLPPDVETDFERVPQPGGYVFRMRPHAVDRFRDDTVQQALETVERRVNELGVAEAVVARYTQRDQILVQLPGVSDFDGARQILRSTAQLRLTLVEQGPFASREAALQTYGNGLPRDLEILPWQDAHEPGGGDAFYVVRRVAAVTGTDLRNARSSVDQFSRPAVAFSLKQDAADRFGAFTEQNLGRLLATVLDDHVRSVARIESRIDREGQIVGLGREEMVQQVITLRSGALPADLEYVEERTVGASLGRASVRAGVLASATGLALVGLFMVGYYRGAGLNALVSIAANLLILVGAVAWIPVTMTLPGIAGLILTIGMGVDSNVLIFERIKEELAAGRLPRAAVNTAFDRVWITIVDTHVASLIAAALLFQFGTTPIKGFATTLAIGLLANVFTAVFVSKTLFLLRLGRQPGGTGTVDLGWRTLRRTTIDFARWRRHALAFSLILTVGGVASLLTRGMPLGIDFSGGTHLIVEFTDANVTEDDVRDAVTPLPGESVVQRYGAEEERRFLIRLPLRAADATADSLDTTARDVAQAIDRAHLPASTVVSRELVTAIIGDDLQRRGIYAALGSLAGITGYIAVRFRPSFAAGGIVATLHDVVVTLGCLSLAGYDLSLNVTAALLTILGYSVNDTIVVFDRVRETLKGMRQASLATAVNVSVNQTLSRTLITAGTTLLASLALFLFGGEALEAFAFTLLIGVLTGTYSTVFVASALAIVLSRRGRKAHGAAA